MNLWNQIRSANSLLSIIHSMKLLLLLSDESQIANRRDIEHKALETEKIETKQKVAELLDQLLNMHNSETSPNNPQDS